MLPLNDNRELFERIVSAIRDIKYFQRKDILEIRMNPDKYDLLMSSCPPELINLSESGTVKFYGVPIVKTLVKRDTIFEIQTF